MSPRFTVAQVLGWLEESERCVEEAETLYLLEGGSPAARALLGFAQVLRVSAICRALEVVQVAEIAARQKSDEAPSHVVGAAVQGNSRV